MGAELVAGCAPLVAADDCVYIKTIDGMSRIDLNLIYRRINDDFLDPEAFCPDSMLGVRNLMRAWRRGNVGIADAPGTGVTNDKVVYTYVAKIIRYYRDQDPKFSNVPSYLCINANGHGHAQANLDKVMVKPANVSGGYGMLIGPRTAPRNVRNAGSVFPPIRATTWRSPRSAITA